MTSEAFYDGAGPIQRTLVIGTLAYIVLVLFLRISGKRTLSKLNAFDFIITVALGSTLATILLNKDVSLAQGAAGLALLILLQFIITWSSAHIPFVRKIVTGEPRLLLYQGAVLRDSMRKGRVTEDEMRAAARASGLAAISDAAAIVLETDGSITVIASADNKEALRKMQGADSPTYPVETEKPKG